MKTQWPSTLYHSVVLEMYGSPYTLGIFTNEKDAIARLEVARRQSNAACPEQIWFYTLRVENGVVTQRHDLSFKNPMQEECAAM